MNYPQIKKAYCPRCKTHTDHNVSLYKKRKDRGMAHGARRYKRKKKGYGSQPKEVQRKKAKLNKRSTPLLKCKDCGHQYYGNSLRLKKFIIVR